MWKKEGSICACIFEPFRFTRQQTKMEAILVFGLLWRIRFRRTIAPLDEMCFQEPDTGWALFESDNNMEWWKGCDVLLKNLFYKKIKTHPLPKIALRKVLNKDIRPIPQLWNFIIDSLMKSHIFKGCVAFVPTLNHFNINFFKESRHFIKNSWDSHGHAKHRKFLLEISRTSYRCRVHIESSSQKYKMKINCEHHVNDPPMAEVWRGGGAGTFPHPHRNRKTSSRKLVFSRGICFRRGRNPRNIK